MIALWHVALVFIFSMCYRSSQLGIPSSPNQNVLLLTAHPDDETMFFAPTVLAFTSEVYSLCLSNGDVDGLGTVRAKELNNSLDILGIKSNKRALLSHPYAHKTFYHDIHAYYHLRELQDNITAIWDSTLIAEITRPYIKKWDITTVCCTSLHLTTTHHLT